jgi:hypothetical protein
MLAAEVTAVGYVQDDVLKVLAQEVFGESHPKLNDVGNLPSP